MKILITNDDGILSKGLRVLTTWAAKLGEVTVAAPCEQQSGKSHAIAIHNPFEIKQVRLGLGEKRAYSVASTPVDCVRYATLGLNESYDLVLSGINRGYNLGEDVLYSGTVGAAFEAALRGLHCIALSTVPETFEHAEKNLDAIYRYFIDNKLFDYNLSYNVNVPPTPKGIAVTKQGGAYFTDDFCNVSGNNWVQNGYCVHENKHDLSLDTDATIDGWITVTPLTTNRSDVNVWAKLGRH